MESYVLRIYRRTRTRPPALLGVLELAETGERLAFHDAPSLWHALLVATRGRNARRAPVSRSVDSCDIDRDRQSSEGGTP